MSLFAHLQNSTVGNTGTDAAGLVHVYRLVDLGPHVMLLENSRNIVGLLLVYSQLVLCRNNWTREVFTGHNMKNRPIINKTSKHGMLQ